MFDLIRFRGRRAVVAISCMAALGACAFSPLDYIPKHELALIEQQAQAEAPSSKISIKTLLAKALGIELESPPTATAHRAPVGQQPGAHRLALRFDPDQMVADSAHKSKIDDLLKTLRPGAPYQARVLAGPVDEPRGLTSAMNAHRRAFSVGRLLRPRILGVDHRYDPSMPTNLVVLELLVSPHAGGA